MWKSFCVWPRTLSWSTLHLLSVLLSGGSVVELSWNRSVVSAQDSKEQWTSRLTQKGFCQLFCDWWLFFFRIRSESRHSRVLSLITILPQFLSHSTFHYTVRSPRNLNNKLLDGDLSVLKHFVIDHISVSRHWISKCEVHYACKKLIMQWICYLVR